MATKKRGLGRGLGALMADGQTRTETEEQQTAAPKPAPAGDISESISRIPVSKIVKSPWQPRRDFDPDALQELSDSIREHGVLQPLLVRPVKGKFELIAGERRFRASELAGLKEVPAIMMEADDLKVLEIALIENLQREDLNVIEEAEGYRELQQQFGLTQEEIAQKVGKGRATVANALRLLELDDLCRKLVSDGDLSAGHAKVLLSVELPEERRLLAKRVIREGLSVRALEKAVAAARKLPKKPRARKTDLPSDYLRDLTDRLHTHFGTNVRVTPTATLANGKKTKGSIEIDYYNNDDLHRVLTLFGMTEDEY